MSEKKLSAKNFNIPPHPAQQLRGINNVEKTLRPHLISRDSFIP